MSLIAQRDPNLCTFCGACWNTVSCPAGEVLGSDCIGCGACVQACPGQAIKLIEKGGKKRDICISINGERFYVPEGITIKAAMELQAVLFPRKTGEPIAVLAGAGAAPYLWTEHQSRHA